MKRLFIFFIVLLGIVMTGCNDYSPQVTSGRHYYSETKENETQESQIKKDSVETNSKVIIKKIDYDNTSIAVQKISDGTNLELSYTGGCDIRNKYDEIIAITQVNTGQLVYISYDLEKNKMVSMHQSSDFFVYENKKNVLVNIQDNAITIDGDIFSYNKNLLVLSEGVEVSISDVNEWDELYIAGLNNEVYSIIIEKGHGYLSLENESYFEGGWIEIGKDHIKPLKKEEEYCVTEGTYEVTLSKNGHSGMKSVYIERNKHVVLNVSDLIGEEVKQGSVIFEIEPETALLYIDNKKVDHKEIVALNYGIHAIYVQAKGYNSLNCLLRVGENLASIPIILTESVTTSTENNTQTSSEKNEQTKNSSNTYSENDNDEKETKDITNSNLGDSSTELLNDVLNQLLND